MNCNKFENSLKNYCRFIIICGFSWVPLAHKLETSTSYRTQSLFITHSSKHTKLHTHNPLKTCHWSLKISPPKFKCSHSKWKFHCGILLNSKRWWGGGGGNMVNKKKVFVRNPVERLVIFPFSRSARFFYFHTLHYKCSFFFLLFPVGAPELWRWREWWGPLRSVWHRQCGGVSVWQGTHSICLFIMCRLKSECLYHSTWSCLK